MDGIVSAAGKTLIMHLLIVRLVILRYSSKYLTKFSSLTRKKLLVSIIMVKIIINNGYSTDM